MQYGMLFTFFGFCDSSHADDIDTFQSTEGYFFFLRKGQGCVCSKSGQTPDVALSSSEAETIWTCSASQQGAFIKQFIDEIKIFSEVKFELHEDSQPAINAQKKNVSQSRFRHIKMLITLIADMATKILSASTIEYFSNIVLGNYD